MASLDKSKQGLSHFHLQEISHLVQKNYTIKSQLTIDMSTVLEEAIRATTTAFVKSYMDATKQKKPKLVSSSCTDNCIRHIGPPAFLRAAGAPANLTLSVSEYEAEFGDMSLYTITSFEIHNITVDTANHKAAAWSVLHCDFIDGTKEDRTHAWFLDLNEDGSKVIKVYQHNDTQEGIQFRNKVQAMKNATSL